MPNVTSEKLYEMIERIAELWRHQAMDNGAIPVNQLATELRTKLETGYLGDLYRTTFVVEGTDPFPVDMLRYTSSYPLGERDGATINDSIASRGGRTKHRVMLVKTHRDKEPALSETRWASKFHWNVVEVRETIEI